MAGENRDFSGSIDPRRTRLWRGPRAGLRSVGQYQMSGIPWLSGSTLEDGAPNQGEVKITFPRVTKSFTIVNTGSVAGGIDIHFDSRANGAVTDQNHYITLASKDSSFSFDVITKVVYVSLNTTGGGTGGFQISAELTGVDPGQMFEHSGSGINAFTTDKSLA